MARKTKQLTIHGEPGNRDNGKTFLLTEMPAMQAEKWAVKAFLALAKNGLQVPEDVAHAGLSGIASLGLHAISGLSMEAAEPLLDEMFQCVQIVEPAVTRRPTPNDIEEVTTLLTLRKEVFTLHTGFFGNADHSTSE